MSFNLDENGRPVRPPVSLLLPGERRPVVASRIEEALAPPKPVPQLLLDHNRTHVVIGVKIGPAVIPTAWTPDEVDNIIGILKQKARLVRGGEHSCPTASPPTGPPASPPPAGMPSMTAMQEMQTGSVFTTLTCGDDCDCPSSESSPSASPA